MAKVHPVDGTLPLVSIQTLKGSTPHLGVNPVSLFVNIILKQVFSESRLSEVEFRLFFMVRAYSENVHA